jgi:hypothetical protein
MNDQTIAAVVVVLSVFSCFQVYGHRPIEAKEKPNHHTRALKILRPDVSQVYYGALEVAKPQVWFRFEGKENQKIYFSVGVPVIDRLKGYRPNVALIGPGLDGSGLDGPGLEGLGFDSADLPSNVTQDLSVEIYASQGAPRFFHEHFTGTESWIHIEDMRTLRRSGTYYLVAYTPAGPRPGDKLWLSIGTKERFKLRDLFTFSRWKREIREFHELR